MKRRRLLLVVVFLAAIAAAGWAIWLSSRLPPEFEAVQSGMTVAEVRTILGREPSGHNPHSEDWDELPTAPDDPWPTGRLSPGAVEWWTAADGSVIRVRYEMGRVSLKQFDPPAGLVRKLRVWVGW